MSIWKQLLVLLVIATAAAGGYYTYNSFLATHEEQAGGSGLDRAVPVEIGHAGIRTMRRTVEAVGTTRARQSIEIVSLASGRVEEITFRPGQQVKAGDVLVRLDDDIERADLTEAQAQSVEQTQALERTRQLRGTNAVSLSTLEQTEAAKAAADAAVDRAERRLEDRAIHAPFAGIVGLSEIDVGARVDDDVVLTTLDDLTAVIVQFSLPETLYAEIGIEQPIQARSAAFSDRVFDGKVTHIDSRIDPVSRAFKVRATVPNPGGLLPGGMFMSLTLTLSEDELLVIPEESIVVQAADTFVFLVENNRAVRRPVVTGQRRDGVVSVVSGLADGDAVVIRGLQRVRNGSTVTILAGSEGTDRGSAVEEGS